MRPIRRGGCGGRSSMTSHLTPGDQLRREVVGALHGDVEFHRLNVGIGEPLLFGGIQPGIDGRVGAVAAAQPRQRLEARRSIGSVVMS